MRTYRLRRLALTLLFATASGQQVCGAEPAAPVVPAHVVLKPTFMSGYDSFSGGTAFLCRVPGREKPLLLTAHHLFGPACGLERDLTWQEAPQTYLAVTGLSIADPTVTVTSTRPLVIPGARGSDDNGYAEDVAAYETSLPSIRATLSLATTPPKEGDWVFLHGRQRGKTELEMLPAQVIASAAAELVYRFKATKVALAGTSGAPVLNSQGEVVAINVGGGEQDGATLGMGNPAASVHRLLSKAR